MKIITRVESGETISHRGDLTIEQSVAENATVIVEDGSLIIKGHVGDGARLNIIISQELRNKSIMNVFSNSVGVSIGGSLTFNTLSIRGKQVSTENNIRSNLCINNQYIGNVIVDNRIFTNDILRCIDNDVFEIIPMNQDNMRSSVTLFSTGRSFSYSSSSSSSSSSSNKLATATIDGKVYTGTKTHVNGRTVRVEGLNPIAALPEEEILITPPKLEVLGAVGNYVTISSDAHIQLNSVGNHCQITSAHDGITAGNIGKNSRIETKEAIKVRNVGDDCSLKSHQYGIDFSNLGDRVNINAKDAIAGQDIGDGCTLTSQHYGLTAGNIGIGVTINVREAIKVKNIGASTTLSSKQYGLNAHHAADLVNIVVREGIELLSLGSNCNVTSDQYGISIVEAMGSHNTLTCREDLYVDSMRDFNTLKSHQNKVRVRGIAGNNCTINARESIRLNDIGDNAQIISSQSEVIVRNIGSYANISARDDIDIMGVSPNPESCRFNTRARVIKPKLALVSRPPIASTLFTAPSSSLPIKTIEVLLASIPAAISPISDIPDHLCCTITLDIMKDPVICTLDGMTYERSAITQWLTEHRETPLRIKMLAEQEVGKILVVNRAIQSAIEEYHSKSSSSFAPG